MNNKTLTVTTIALLIVSVLLAFSFNATTVAAFSAQPSVKPGIARFAKCHGTVNPTAVSASNNNGFAHPMCLPTAPAASAKIAPALVISLSNVQPAQVTNVTENVQNETTVTNEVPAEVKPVATETAKEPKVKSNNGNHYGNNTPDYNPKDTKNIHNGENTYADHHDKTK